MFSVTGLKVVCRFEMCILLAIWHFIHSGCWMAKNVIWFTFICVALAVVSRDDRPAPSTSMVKADTLPTQPSEKALSKKQSGTPSKGYIYNCAVSATSRIDNCFPVYCSFWFNR